MIDKAQLRIDFAKAREEYNEIYDQAFRDGDDAPGENVDLDNAREWLLTLALGLIDADYGRSDDAT